METHEAHHHGDSPVKEKGWLRRKLAAMRLVLLTWLASTGLIATTSTCPFCGQAGCPVGIGQ
ncbi:MAG: hypothetical protein ACTSXZ_05910, partial [Alphaproteobacteria bacterium]